jgi:hypothetical protein
LQHESTYLKQPIIKNGSIHKQPDELDLISLLEKAISFINSFKIILSGFFIAGLGLGLYFYFSSPMQYSTRLIVHSEFLSNQDEIEIIDNWKDLLASGEKAQLASIMNCRENVVAKLNSISAEEILKIYVSNNPNSFLINVSVTDTSIINELQNGIVYGLNNSPYVKEKIASRKAKDTELIKTVTEEIAKLNSTKNSIDSMIKNGNKNASPLLVDISRINAEWIDLNEKSLSYQEDLRFLTGVRVTENFNKGKMTRPGFLKLSVLGMAAGCFLGFLISLILYAVRKVKEARIKLAIP